MIDESVFNRMQAVCDSLREAGFDPVGLAQLQEFVDEVRSEEDPFKAMAAGFAFLELFRCMEAVAKLKAGGASE